MERLLQDLVLSVRRLGKNPGFTLVVVASLALGIGANTTIFTLAQAVFSFSFPFDDPDKIVMAYGSAGEGDQDGIFQGYIPISYPNFRDLQEQNEVFAHFSTLHGTMMGLSGDGNVGEPEQIQAAFVSGCYFDIFGFNPTHGRFFQPEEDKTPGSHPVVVLSHGLWSRRFGADTGIVGQNIQLNGHSLTVVGIAPRGFKGTNVTVNVEAFVPNMMFTQMSRPPLNIFFENRAAEMFFALGRLKDGVELDRADANMDTLAQHLQSEYPKESKSLHGMHLIPLSQSTVLPAQRGVFAQAGGLLAVVAGVLLLIACANVANLLLAKAASRRQEIAVRMALGAERGSLIRQLLTESVVLALLSTAVAIPIAIVSLNLLWRTRGWIKGMVGGPLFADNTLDLHLDFKILAFTLGVGLLTSVLFGLVPALRTSRPDVASHVRERFSSDLRIGRRLKLRHFLVVAQMGLSLVALIGAGLFLKSLDNAQAIDPGFVTENIGMMSFDPVSQGYEQHRVQQFYRDVVERVTSLPEVEEATLSEVRALTLTFFRNAQLEGQSEDQRNLVMANSVGTGYFDLLGIPLVRGRNFFATDREDTRPVAVINETLASSFWPGENAVGKQFSFRGEENSIEVIGVVEDARYVSLGEEPRPYIYLSLEQRFITSATLYFRTTVQPSVTLERVRREVQSLAPDLPLTDVQELDKALSAALGAPRMGAVLLSIYGGLTLLLALIGIYSVMAHSVAQRFRELGLRMALGARGRDVLGMVIKDGVLVAVLGMVLGLALALALTRLIASLLYGVSPMDFGILVLTSALLIAAAVLACFIPALRASRIDPMVALRYDE